jgi:hypothetical protein
MALPVISVRNLGKRYHLGVVLQHNTLRDHITHGFKSVFNAFRRVGMAGWIPRISGRCRT